jgi:hypothetical protein
MNQKNMFSTTTGAVSGRCARAMSTAKDESDDQEGQREIAEDKEDDVAHGPVAAGRLQLAPFHLARPCLQ